MRILAGDIGGTKTLLQLVDIGSGARTVLLERRYESDAFPTFYGMLQEFLSLDPGPVAAACFAVAGPVIGGHSEITNLEWVIESEELTKQFPIGRVVLTNDFSAVAVGVPLLGPEDVVSLNAGSRDLTMPIGILGAGTGLGEAILVPGATSWKVVASEGGHADFAPVDETQIGLLKYLDARFGRVSYERVLSGPGLVNIFTYLRDHEFQGETAARDLMSDDENLPAELSKLADEGDPLATRTFEVFIDIYGAEAGNVALRVIARGGIYIAGGIATKNASRFTDGRFLRAFRTKGRFDDFMDLIPVDLITNAKVGLMGAVEMAATAAEA